ncbi:ferredoxin [Mycobacterium colombiense]
MRISVDYSRCDGHGVCEGVADDLFELGDQDAVRIRIDPIPTHRHAAAEEAVKQCPKVALTITNE